MKRNYKYAVILMFAFCKLPAMDKLCQEVLLKNGAKENGITVLSVYSNLILLSRHENVVFNELVEAVQSSHSITPNARIVLEQFRLMPGQDMIGRVMENIILSLSMECNADSCTRLFLSGKEDFIVE